MHLENLVVDAVDPQRLGRFWEAAVGGDTLTDAPGIYETRLAVVGGPELDLCFQPVGALPTVPPRLHLDLLGGAGRPEVVERLIGLGATPVDVGQGDVPWTVLADPEGNPFCVMPEREEYSDTGPVAMLPLDSGDPDRDAAFWSWLTGWTDPTGTSPRLLRHPSSRGPILALCPEDAPKAKAKNRWHLDLRLDAGDDPDVVTEAIVERGGRELHPAWADEVPWRLYADPSGNDFCVLPTSTHE